MTGDNIPNKNPPLMFLYVLVRIPNSVPIEYSIRSPWAI